MAITHRILSARDWWAENKSEKRPVWKKLIAKLLQIAPESAVVVNPDPDVKQVAERGTEMSIAGRKFKRGMPSQCHRNAAALYANGDVDTICTGYALADDNGWRQHTWGLKDGKIIETTYRYQRYFGVRLNKKESKMFVESNPPEL